ncbi:hypothetical protein BUALT_Bualt05G0009300 [Buddleja alternifolia]|uniref:Uncharacterized protein n=1 Tax=Buddleja alternifolia TaxID=168488 RepID=A0AAV6XH04_9LAMI|nr:hypothetical protein BUALT_Bualt05G0009300 [Buddleja alternifolia]
MLSLISLSCAVSYLFGRLTRKKTTSSQSELDEIANGEETSDDGGGGDENAAYSGGDGSSQTSIDDQPAAAPQHHMRTASCHQRSRSASKLVWSLSTGLLGGGGQSSKLRRSEKKLKHEDSIWKKTIILGEKCRVPDEDDDTILYDENGNRISTYHPKNTVGIRSFSRQNSSVHQGSIPSFEQLSRK